MAIFTRFSHLTLAATLLIGSIGICGNLVSVAIFARREVAINFTNLPQVSFQLFFRPETASVTSWLLWTWATACTLCWRCWRTWGTAWRRTTQPPSSTYSHTSTIPSTGQPLHCFHCCKKAWGTAYFMAQECFLDATLSAWCCPGSLCAVPSFWCTSDEHPHDPHDHDPHWYLIQDHPMLFHLPGDEQRGWALLGRLSASSLPCGQHHHHCRRQTIILIVIIIVITKISTYTRLSFDLITSESWMPFPPFKSFFLLSILNQI